MTYGHPVTWLSAIPASRLHSALKCLYTVDYSKENVFLEVLVKSFMA
jgi:hypothetical protein